MRGATTGLDLRVLTFEEFESEAEEYDRLVGLTPGIDSFCTSSNWILPAHHALMPPRTSWILRCDAGYIPLTRGTGPDGDSYLQPLEAAWGLASCFVGRDPVELVPRFVASCMSHDHAWRGIFLTGVVPQSQLFREIIVQFTNTERCDVYLGSTARRYTASLEGGLDGFLSRRSKNFRRNLRKSSNRAARDGITFEAVDMRGIADASTLYQRIVDVEGESWKGRALVGINTGDMYEFYRRMLPRLVREGNLRLSFARQEGIDIGYVLGAVTHNVYRGLQFSFDERFEPYSLGNLLQIQEIERLCEEGVGYYDLGSDAEYKERWAEGGLRTVTLIIRRR